MSDGCVSSSRIEKRLSTVKWLDRSLQDKINFKHNSHADTIVVGSNVFDIHDHTFYLDIIMVLNLCKNITIIDAAIAYDDPQKGGTLVLLAKQTILIPECSGHVKDMTKCHEIVWTV